VTGRPAEASGARKLVASRPRAAHRVFKDLDEHDCARAGEEQKERIVPIASHQKNRHAGEEEHIQHERASELGEETHGVRERSVVCSAEVCDQSRVPARLSDGDQAPRHIASEQQQAPAGGKQRSRASGPLSLGRAERVQDDPVRGDSATEGEDEADDDAGRRAVDGEWGQAVCLEELE